MHYLFTFKRICGYIVTLTLFTSCSPLIWPSAYQVPMLKQQGDIHLNAMTGTSDLNLQASVLPVNHLVLSSAYSTSVTNRERGHVYHHSAFGLGYINQADNLQFGLMAWYGSGKSRDNSIKIINNQDINYFTQVTYRNFQIQPYFNFLISDDTELYTGIRGSLIRTKAFSTNETTRISPGNTGTFEPFVGLRQTFIDKLTVELQAGIYSHKNTYNDNFFKGAFNRGETLLIMQIGLGYRINLKKQSKN